MRVHRVDLTPFRFSVILGTGCAATATGLGLKEVRQAKKSAEDTAEANARIERERLAAIEDTKWQAFLDRHVAPHQLGHKVERIYQISHLGGWTKGGERYRSKTK